MTKPDRNIPMLRMRLNGLVAATYTPLDQNGDLNLEVVPKMVDHLLSQGVSGLYVCGSTGEGMSLSSDERRLVAEAYVKATDRRVPVIVQVGHNSLTEAKQLAEHAQRIGADMFSATCPSYFKVSDVATLVDCMAQLASGAPDLPFYYYHIPALTGSTIDVVEFLKRAGDRIPNLTGLKYTDTKLHEFQECLELDEGRLDVVWGCDEMFVGALATGARGAIGSTFNIIAPLYRRIMTAFADSDFVKARRLQSQSINMIRALSHFPFHPAMKAVLGMQGFHVGGCRLPQGHLSAADVNTLRNDLESIGFFEWSQADHQSLPLKAETNL
ncbi:MAG: dihydrodipicolinate synthase family protein [Fuerstiella sp.]